MKTKSKSKGQSSAPHPPPRDPSIPQGGAGTVIFFGPNDTINKIQSQPVENIGARVTRQDVKNLGIEYVHRVLFKSLNAHKEAMVLKISKEEMKALLETEGFHHVKAMLAVEVNEKFGQPHQTFVLMPCDENGKVIVVGGTAGWERWSIGRNVDSVVEDGGVVNGVEKFLTEFLHI